MVRSRQMRRLWRVCSLVGRVEVSVVVAGGGEIGVVTVIEVDDAYRSLEGRASLGRDTHRQGTI